MASVFPLDYVYLAFSAVFLMGSIVCGTAHTSIALIAGRAIAGAGAAGVAANGMAILIVIPPPKLKPIFMGVGAACFGIGLILSPVLGGV